MLTKIVFNKRTKNYDGEQPQLGDSVVSKEDITNMVAENLISCSTNTEFCN